MSVRRREKILLAAGLAATQFFLGSTPAQDAASWSVARKPPPLPAATSAPSSVPVKSPVDFFRELLAMTLAERKKTVADRPLENQRRLLAKVREYESLKPDQRELRLRVTELRWYLLPLMSTPATNRAVQLALIPEDDRKLVEDRLQQWDKLPSAARKDLLENEQTIQYFTQFEFSSAEQRQRILAGISPARRLQLEAGIWRWQSLSEDQRRKMGERFDRFFDLTPGEQEKALNSLSEAERRQMERTLRSFEKLPKVERALCIKSFEKFASMSLQ